MTTSSVTESRDTSSRHGGHLRRDVRVIGLLFASVGSIIGSGWLFGALNAAQAAGPPASAASRTCRSGRSPATPPAGSPGWPPRRSPPIEVEGALQYATKFFPFTTEHTVAGETVHTLTGLGYGVAVAAMAVFVMINCFGVRWFAHVNNVLVRWKLAIITLVIVAFLVTVFHGSNFTSYGSKREGWHGVFTAIARERGRR